MFVRSSSHFLFLYCIDIAVVFFDLFSTCEILNFLQFFLLAVAQVFFVSYVTYTRSCVYLQYYSNSKRAKPNWTETNDIKFQSVIKKTQLHIQIKLPFNINSMSFIIYSCIQLIVFLKFFLLSSRFSRIFLLSLIADIHRIELN